MIGIEMEVPIGAASGGSTAAVARRLLQSRLALAAAVVAIGLVGPETSSARLRDGDVLVLDLASARVLRVRPSTGAVAVVTPRPGHPQILASGERAVDMAIAPDGRIHLRGELEGQIVAVDPAKGAQSLRFVSDGTSNPSPLQVEPGSIAFDALGDFYAYATDSRALSRYTLGPADVLIGPTPVATLSAAISSGRSLSVASQGDASPPMLLFLAGDAAGLAGVDAQSGLAVGFAGVPATGLGRVWAVEAVQPCLSVFCSAIFIEQIGVEPPLQCLSVAIRRAALINGVSGSTTLYEGVDPDDCALALAGAPIDPPMLVPPVIYVATGRPLSRPSARIERIVDTESGRVREPVATITPGAGSEFAVPIRMAVWTLPEPGSAMAGWAALFALGALGRRAGGSPRRSRLVRRVRSPRSSLGSDHRSCRRVELCSVPEEGGDGGLRHAPSLEIGLRRAFRRHRGEQRLEQLAELGRRLDHDRQLVAHDREHLLRLLDGRDADARRPVWSLPVPEARERLRERSPECARRRAEARGPGVRFSARQELDRY